MTMVIILHAAVQIIPISPTKVGQEVWGVEGMEKGKLAKSKGRREKGRCPDLVANSSRQPDRENALTHERNETKRFPGRTHPPTSD